MYKVNEWHCRPTYRRGDLEAEEVIINVTSFRTKKEAKEFIEGKLRGKQYVWRRYQRGSEKSYCGYYTGKTWIHENNGETYRESFTYELSKE